MVNTFLIGSFEFTAKNLDPRRKLKQAVESKQIIDIINNNNEKVGFHNHPIVKMWRDYVIALKHYFNFFIDELQKDGVNLNLLKKFENLPTEYDIPWFTSFEPLIFSHRARLYQKNPLFYKDKFSFPSEYLNIGYIWTCRFEKEYYLSNIDKPHLLADELQSRYINPKYCPAIIKSGKNEGQVCNNMIKDSDNFCNIHNKTKIKNKTQSLCEAILKSGSRKGELCNRKSQDNSKFCGLHK